MSHVHVHPKSRRRRAKIVLCIPVSQYPKKARNLGKLITVSQYPKKARTARTARIASIGKLGSQSRQVMESWDWTDSPDLILIGRL